MTHRFSFPGGTNRMRPGSRRPSGVRRLLASFAAALPLVLGFQFATSLLPVRAVDATGQFAMDGTIAGAGSPSATPPFHWADLFDANGHPILTHSSYPALLDSVFVQDYATPDNSYFVPTKDINSIGGGGWSCAPQATPTAKDDIQNTYGAVFRIPNTAGENAGHYVAYLGVERLTNNGDSFAGFWLLKDSTVGCSGTSNFSGHHTDGDILILTNFTNGGGVASVSVYRWTGDDATGAPVPVTTGNVCGVSPGGTSGDRVCAISNTSTITSPWATAGTPTTSHPAQTFTEAGIDLTALFGGTASGPCFSNFMAETRSSQQITATLKDFAGGVLDTCITPSVTTSASGNGSSNLPGSAQHDTATMVVPTGDPAPTGSITFYLCDPTHVTSAGCPTGAGTQVGLPVSLSSGAATSTPDVTGITTPNDLATGTYCWGAQYTPDSASIDSYLASYGTDATHECFTVAKASPGLTTVAGFASGSADLSSAPKLSDTATLTGAATGALGQPAGESVSFSLFGPYAAGITPTCATGSGQPVFTTTGILAASGGNFVAPTASSYSPTATGTYVWTASYAGDTYNSSASEGCNAANESTTITTPQLHISKTADNATVSAGTQIGFTITVSNDAAASGSATGVTISDPLQGGSGIHWTVASQDGTACTVNSSGAQTLSCSIGTLAPGASYSVHVTSPTTASSCATYNNTATGHSSNETSADVTASASTTVQCPNVSVTKKADNATVNAGDPMGFTVTVSNSGVTGTGTATNVSVSDPLPAGTGVDWSIDSQDGSACAISGSAGSQSLDCTITSLAPGAHYAVHITSATEFASCTDYANVASVTVGNENGGPFIASDTVTVQCPGLQITKTTDTALVSTGSDIHFQVTVSNSGPGTAANVTVDDPLPAGSGVDWSIAGQDGTLCAINGNVGSQDLQCSLGDMAPSTHYTIHITSHTTANSAGTYPNTATASADNAPSVHDSATVVVIAPDVTVTKTADNAVVDAGSPIGFTVTITNSSAANTGTATGVTVADPLPMGTGVTWTIASQSSTNCMITVTDGGTPGQELDCLSFSLAAGASYTVHITSTTEYQSCGVYDNTAHVTVPNQSGSPLSSNQAQTEVQCPDLGITKTADATPVSTETSIGFTVTVTNGGPGTATAVTVDDPLPGGTGIHWSIDTQDGSACSIITTASGQDLTCTLGDMAAGATYGVHITSATTAGSAGTYPNTATVSSTNAPSQQAGATVVVIPPDPTITKTADAANVNAGDTIGFTIAVSNDSAPGGTARDVTITDPLPAGAGVNWSINPAYSGPGTCAITGAAGQQTLTCNLGSMAPGAKASVHIASATTSATCSTLNNTATVTSSNAPTAQASASIAMTCASVLGASTVPVPVTGLGVLLVPAPAVALIASGIMLIMGVVVRRRRTRE